MAKVHFAPFCAIRYVGAEDKVFNTSLARPKPMLKNGDIIIVDKVTAFNLVKKGFGDFEDVNSIDLSEDGTASAALKDENEKLKQELLVALASLAEATQGKTLDIGIVASIVDAAPIVDEVAPIVDAAPIVDEVAPIVDAAPIVDEVTPIVDVASLVDEVAPIKTTTKKKNSGN